MINVIIEVLEYLIGHTLEVNEIHLSANTESIRDDILHPGHRLPMAKNLDTVRKDVHEHLAHLLSDVTMPIPCTGEKGITPTVIFLVDLSEVSKSLATKVGCLSLSNLITNTFTTPSLFAPWFMEG